MNNIRGFVVVPVILASLLIGICAAAGVHIYNKAAAPQVDKIIK